MSSYPPPTQILSIFNSDEFNYVNNNLTYITADSRYLRLTGGTETGLVRFNNGLTTSTIYNTGTLTLPTTTGTLALTSQIPTSADYVDLTTNQSIGGIKTFTNYVLNSSQYGLFQWNVVGCTLYSSVFTAGLGGFQIDTSSQSTGFGILKLPSMGSSATYTFPSATCALVGDTIAQTLSNKTLNTTNLNGILYANTQNTVALGSQTNYISMFDNPIYLRGQNSTADKNHYLIFGNVSGNSYAGQLTDGPALVGFGGGILGTSNSTWALKWNNSGQCLTDTSGATGTPWTAPKYSFNGFINCGVYFSTDNSTYKTVGTAINGKYISYTGINPSNDAAYFNVSNNDATYMGGFNATSGTGSGYFEVNGYLYVNGGQNQTYSYGYLNSSGATGTGSGTNSYSIMAANRIKGSEFNAVSSKKIKTVQASLNDTNTMNEAINLFKSIPLSKYIYTDSQQHDIYTHYGLIAEDMPNGIYTDNSQSGYVPNIYKMGVIDSVDEKGTANITLNNAISADKLITITNMNYLLCYGSEDEGKTFSKFEVLENLTITDDTHLTAYLPDYQEYDHAGLTLLIYGTQETIPNITKNNYFELMACVVKSLLSRIEELEIKTANL